MDEASSQCNKCGVIKPLDKFYKDKNRKCGVTRWCIECMKHQNNKWKDENKDKINEYMDVYRDENKDKIATKEKEYKEAHREELLEMKRKWNKNNKEKYIASKRRYAEKVKNNPHLYVAERLRNRIRKVLLGINKSKPTMELLGCDIKTFLHYIEDKMLEGMTWENYGEWHLDHIKPCAMFDLTKPEEQVKCFHYSNLQPLWQHDNCSKGARWIG